MEVDVLVERIAEAMDETDGAEDRFRTVLFADINNFAELCLQVKSTDAVAMLNAYFDRMVNILEDYDATVDKILEDRMLVSFGRQEDGAHRAVAAALAMVAAVPEISKKFDQKVQPKIGVHSGHVIVGHIGSRVKGRDFTLIGSNVNIARRMKNVAKANDVLISEATWKLLGAKVQVDAKAPVSVKGPEGDFNAFRVKSVSPVTTD